MRSIRERAVASVGVVDVGTALEFASVDIGTALEFGSVEVGTAAGERL